MRHMDESKKQTILNFVNDYYDRYRRAPAVKDISSGTGIANTTVHRYLLSMKEEGILEYNGRRNIGTTHTRKEVQSRMIPLLGRVCCGPGDYEEENIIEYLTMPDRLVGKGEFFALEAKGNSMVDAGVHDGEYVFIRKQNTAEIGDIIVALYDDGLNNLKKLCYDHERQQYYLYSCNKDQETYAPIYVDELRIQGVAVSVMHSLVQR